MGDVYTNPPQSRNEAILRATIDGTEYTAPPQSRIEDLLLELKEAIEQGGTGEGDMKKSVYDADRDVQNAGGIKPFVNGAIGTLPQRVGTVEGKVSTLEGQMLSVEDDLDALGTASTKNSTSTVTDSTDLVESGAVYSALQGKANNTVITKNFETENYSRAYSIGEHFMNDGVFRTVKSVVSSGDTITDNNSFVDTVGDLTTGNFTNPATNVTFGITQYMRNGNVMNIRLTFTASEEIARATDIGKCPYGRAGSYNQYLTSLDGKVFYLTASGTIRNDEVLQAGQYTVIGTVMV